MKQLVAARFDEIKLIWRREPHTERLIVGTLRRLGDGSFEFTYDGPDLERAKALGFLGYPGLPSDVWHFAGYAMDAFAARNPSPARSDYERLLSLWAIPSDADAFTIIGLTGGRLPTDLFEFVPVILPSPDTEFITNLAGIKHYAESEAFRNMPVGTKLEVQLDPENAFDADAVKVLADGNLVAFIKKGHSTSVAAALRKGLSVECTLERALVNGVVREVLVRIRFQ